MNDCDVVKEKVFRNLLFLVTAQNLVGNFTETPQQPSKIDADFPENAFLPPNFEQLPFLFIFEAHTWRVV